jgi:hypothetical protein
VVAHPGYAIVPLLDVLRALKVANMDVKSLKRILNHVEKLPRWDRATAYQVLEEAFVTLCPGERITPQDLVDIFFSQRAGNETITDFLFRFSKGHIEKRLTTKEPHATTSSLQHDYFQPKAGRLEHAPLPYQTVRNLQAGIRDLQGLALAKDYLWEDIAEGFWIFDPKTEVWYSLGGKTQIGDSAVRQVFLEYDISTLTRDPYLFHVHPEGLEIHLSNPYSDFPTRELKKHAVKFYSSTPSRADYALVGDLMKATRQDIEHPRSFIVHSLGVTEFTYPEDPSKLDTMAIQAQSIRDEAAMNFRWDKIVLGTRGSDYVSVVKRLMKELNARMPEGFSVKFYPKGSKLIK